MARSEERPSDTVYVVKGGRFVKIGITNNIAMRLPALQNGTPVKLTVAFTLAVSPSICKVVEREAHAILRDRRIAGGEWFRASVRDARRAVIQAHKTGQASQPTERALSPEVARAKEVIARLKAEYGRSKRKRAP